MSKSIYFTNEGEIDVRAVTTMGVSVKDTDSAVGYFGTGFKYAVARILRAGGKVTLWAGEQKHKFTTSAANIRGESFELVCMDGQPLGFTTKLGRDWKPWMAYRELACNATDEGGRVTTENVKPKAGTTVIEVSCEEIFTAHRDRLAFMLGDSEPVYAGSGCQAHPRRGNSEPIFFKGIAVTGHEPCLYRYNVTRDVQLTEDRTAMYNFQTIWRIRDMWASCNNKRLLREVLACDDNMLEGTLEWHNSIVSNAWLAVVDEMVKKGKRVTRSMDQAYARRRNRLATVPENGEELRPDQRAELDSAIAFLKRAGFPVDEFPIVFSSKLGEGILGRAAGDKIYLSPQCFMNGDTCLIGTLLEEWLHLAKGHDDCSRAMQNWLFDALIGQMKRAAFLEQNQRTEKAA